MQMRKPLLRPVPVLAYVLIWGLIELVALWRSRRAVQMEEQQA